MYSEWKSAYIMDNECVPAFEPTLDSVFSDRTRGMSIAYHGEAGCHHGIVDITHLFSGRN